MQEWFRQAARRQRPVESSVSDSARRALRSSRERRGQLKQFVRRMASTRNLGVLSTYILTGSVYIYVSIIGTPSTSSPSFPDRK
jgi:hypothetical protein